MKVVVTVAAVGPQHGGPARTVPAFCRALARNGADVELVTIAERRSGAPSIEATGFKATVIETDATCYQPRSWSAPYKKALKSTLHAKDVILYNVGLWLPANHFAAQIADRTRTPFVVSPRGMLSTEALTVARWKKRVAWLLYQKSDLKVASAFHATSEGEARDIRSRNLSQPIALIPNGVEGPSRLPERSYPGSGARTLLFLSRIHPIKGLKDLVKAWARIRPAGWNVVVAGPDENEHGAEIKSLIASLGLESEFSFAGSVDDETKWKLLRAADLFVLPSYSESFGLAIAEALAAELPVITTRATPWRELESHQCGYWIENGVDALADCLALATKKSRNELEAMGKRGRALVLEKYSWDAAAQKMVSVFDWLIGRGDRPQCAQ